MRASKVDIRGFGALFLIVVVSACGVPAESTASSVVVTEADSVGVRTVTISGDLGELPEWSLSLEPVAEIRGDEEPFLGTVGEVLLLGDGRVLVEDDQGAALYAFDGAGFELWGGEGDGPGEFRNITSLSTISGDTSVAYDRRHNRISVFDPDGVLTRTVSVDAEIGADGAIASAAWALNGDRFVLAAASPRRPDLSRESIEFDRREVLLYPLGRSGELDGEPLAFEGGYSISARGMIVVAPFANVPVLAPGPGYLAFGSATTYDIHFVSPELKPMSRLRWSGWDRPLSPDVVEEARNAVEPRLAQLRERTPETADLISEAMFGEQFLPDRLPALSAMLIDDESRMWVSAFRASADQWSQSRAWHVVGPSGRPLAQVILPDNSRLVAMRGRRVALVVRDELDVEHVRLYELVYGDAS